LQGKCQGLIQSEVMAAIPLDTSVQHSAFPSAQTMEPI